MSIPSQLPNMTLATRPGGLQALALRPSQTITAVVLGQGSDGATQVQVGRQTLGLTLPAPVPPGTTLTLQAQGSGAEQRLVLLQQAPPAAQPATATQTLPAASVPPPAGSAVTTQPGTLQTLGLRPEQMLSGTVLGPGPGGATQVHIERQTFNMILPTPVPPGTVLTLQAHGSGTEQRLVLMQQSLPGTPSVAPPAAASGSLVPELQYTAIAKAAVTQMVQAAVARQDSMAGLMTALSSALGRVPLPEPVLRAGQQILATQLPLGAGGLTGGAVERAVLASGLFQEAMLAAGKQATANGDVKTALLSMRQALVSWLGFALPTPQVGRVPPPVRGVFQRVSPTGLPPDDFAATPEEVGRQLLERTEAALSRLRLHQHASLPDVHSRGGAEWTVDLPVLIGSYQTMMQFQVQRDGGGSGQEPAADRGWQMRFAIDLPVMGEVGAQVTLRAGLTAVMLWALQPQTTAAIEASLPELTQALVEAGLNPSSVHCRQGEPSPPIVASGHFMDRLS